MKSLPVVKVLDPHRIFAWFVKLQLKWSGMLVSFTALHTAQSPRLARSLPAAQPPIRPPVRKEKG